MRVFTLGLLAALNWAPLQCASDQDPSLRRYETPGEALYGLSQQFKAKGDEKAWRSTLEYLISRYPNSRYAVMARDDLGKSEPNPDGDKPEKPVVKQASTDEK